MEKYNTLINYDEAMKAGIIVNPVAGQGKSLKVLPRVRKQLGAHFELEFFHTHKQGDGIMLGQRALEKNCNLIVVLGGDGTISEVVNALAKENVPLGFIPSGTVNVLARELKIPDSVGQACKIIIEGRTKQIDLGQANREFFVLMAGIGFDAQVVQDVNQDVKKMLKDMAYVITGIKTLLTYRPTRISIQADDGEVKQGYFAVVGNAQCYARGFSITTTASIEDGFLDVCIFKQKGIESFARYIGGVLLKKHVNFADVEYLRGKTIKVRAEHSTLVQADGELIGKLPMTFSVVPKGLSVFCPG